MPSDVPTAAQARRLARQREIVNQHLRLVQTGYRRDVSKLITNYKNLAPKIDGMCRFMEANKLLDMTRKWGNSTQKKTVIGLFSSIKLGILLRCSCRDEECEWINWDEQEEVFYCECIERSTMGCHGLYVEALDERGHILGASEEN